MIQQLDHEEIVNMSKLKNSIEFSQQLQNLGLLQALPQRERSNSFVKSKSFKQFLNNQNSDNEPKKIRKNTLLNMRKSQKI